MTATITISVLRLALALGYCLLSHNSSRSCCHNQWCPSVCTVRLKSTQMDAHTLTELSVAGPVYTCCSNATMPNRQCNCLRLTKQGGDLRAKTKQCKLTRIYEKNKAVDEAGLRPHKGHEGISRGCAFTASVSH